MQSMLDRSEKYVHLLQELRADHVRMLDEHGTTLIDASFNDRFGKWEVRRRSHSVLKSLQIEESQRDQT